MIVDVGGGHGRLLAAILSAAPTARGVLYDLPDVVAAAPAQLRKLGVAERVRVEAGSFFESIPAGGDTYVLKHIIHDWPDDEAVVILRKLRAACGAAATVLLVELVIPGHDRDFIGKWADLEMLLGCEWPRAHGATMDRSTERLPELSRVIRDDSCHSSPVKYTTTVSMSSGSARLIKVPRAPSCTDANRNAHKAIEPNLR